MTKRNPKRQSETWGKLFVFEGPDDVGKTTLARFLEDRINKLGFSCRYFSFPGSKPRSLGTHVYDLHRDCENHRVKSIDPTSLQLLHVSAHIDSLHKNIIPALANGCCVVLDRFWWSTYVYGLVSGVDTESLNLMRELELNHWHSIIPAALFLITRSTPLYALKATRKWKKVSTTYQNLAAKEKHSYPIYHIENDSTITGTLQKVLKVVNKVLHNSNKGIAARRSKLIPLKDRPKKNEKGTLLVFSSLSPAKETEVYNTYWRFAVERQNIFFKRFHGNPPPWTGDEILSKYKFTNAYRASDRVSQYLIKNVIYKGSKKPEEIFFRTILFKIFNRIDTWELLRDSVGRIRYSDYSYKKYDQVLTNALKLGKRIYSAAYIMPSGGKAFRYPKKHRGNLKLLERMMHDKVPKQIVEMGSMRQVFELLRSYPTIGDFLAYQYTIDINYGEITNFSEMEFVVPGPGARDGIRKCFTSLGGLSENDIIRLVADRQEKEFEQRELDFQNLWGRRLQLVDCQNLFCEVDKYARLAHPDVKGLSNRMRIKRTYQPNLETIAYWYPPKWHLNERIIMAR